MKTWRLACLWLWKHEPIKNLNYHSFCVQRVREDASNAKTSILLRCYCNHKSGSRNWVHRLPRNMKSILFYWVMVHWDFPFHWIQRIWEITEAWMGFNLRICSVTCVSVIQWYHVCLLHMRWEWKWVQIQQSTVLIFQFLITEFAYIWGKLNWSHLPHHLNSSIVSPVLWFQVGQHSTCECIQGFHFRHKSGISDISVQHWHRGFFKASDKNKVSPS